MNRKCIPKTEEETKPSNKPNPGEDTSLGSSRAGLRATAVLQTHTNSAWPVGSNLEPEVHSEEERQETEMGPTDHLLTLDKKKLYRAVL